MISDSTLRLDHVNLHNFRCFEECAIDLQPDLTVLVAENGGGKTALLDGIRIALGSYIDFVSDKRQQVNLQSSDVRRIYEKTGEMHTAPQATCTADAYLAGQLIHWRRSRKRSGTQPRVLTKDTKDLYVAVQSLREQVGEASEHPLTLPLVAFYGTDRFRREDEKTKRRAVVEQPGRMSAYTGCLDSSSSLKQLIHWYETKMIQAGDPRYATTLSYLIPLITAVEKAMQIVVEPTGWRKIVWEPTQKHLLVEHPEQGRLSPSMLSDGVRTMVALIMDVARRCFSLNPHLGEEAAQQTPGVILIDEVDMHLHPRWQQQVVDLLRKVFPKMQMVLSTHSPQVLSTVDKESIRVIRLSKGRAVLEMPQYQTRGVESADVLAKIMNVDPVPRVEESKWLSDYRALVQTGSYETDEAYHLWVQLISHFGEDHPVIDEVKTLRRLQEFKRERNLSQNEDA